MLMSDVIKVLGMTPLKSFPWGCVVIDTVNLFVDESNRLTENSTGDDVNKALESMSEDKREIVLQARLDTCRRCVATSIGGGMIVEHVEESASSDDTLALRKAMMNPQFMALSFMVIIPVMMGFWMISNMSIHRDVDWGELFTAAVKLFGFSFGE